MSISSGAAPSDAAQGDTLQDQRPNYILAGCYLFLALVGLVGTWAFNLQYIRSGGSDYLGSWFANPASSSAALDIIVIAVVASIYYVHQRRRIPGRFPWAWLFIPLSFLVAVSFAFPLFLALSEIFKTRPAAPRTR